MCVFMHNHAADIANTTIVAVMLVSQSANTARFVGRASFGGRSGPSGREGKLHE